MSLQLSLRARVQAGDRQFGLVIDWQTRARRIVIHGPSGAGKSLTLQALAGLLTPDDGCITLDGVRLFDRAAGINVPSRQRRLGYLFQDYALFPQLDVRQNIAFAVRTGWRNPARQLRDPQVEHWIDQFGLRAVATQLPHTLSGGQRQRTALARALVTRPRALLLDEPFSALDAALRARLRDELDGVLQQLDIPLILISHDADDLHRFGDAQLALCDGQLADNRGNRDGDGRHQHARR